MLALDRMSDPAELKSGAGLLGLLQLAPTEWRRWKERLVAVEPAEIEALITARAEARRARNFAEADRIRDELAGMGIQIRDVKDPETGEQKTEWEIAR